MKAQIMSLNTVYLKLLEKFNVWAHAHPAAASVAVIVGPIGLLLAMVALLLLGLLVVLVVVELVQLVVLRLLRAKKPPAVTLLELTFPSETSRSAHATEQLYVLLHDKSSRRTVSARLLRSCKLYALELMGTRDGGIKYIMAVPEREEDLVRKNLQSFLPGLKVEAIVDYLPEPGAPGSFFEVAELKLSDDFVLPLQDHKLLAEHDTMAYLTGQMTKLAPDELVGFQLVAVPVMRSTHPHITRRLARIEKQIRSGLPLTPILRKRNLALPLNFLPILLKVVFTPAAWVLKVVVNLVRELPYYLTDDHYHEHQAASATAAKAQRAPLDPYEAELGRIVMGKTSQHLYEATIRIVVVAGSAEAVRKRLDGLVSSMRSFSSPHQAITSRRNLPLVTSPAIRLSQYRGRVLTTDFIDQNMVLSSSELSDLYHFPNTDLTKTEGLVKNRSPELPAPLSLKGINPEFDVVIGVNNYGGELSPIGLTLEQRQKHMYVIGKTGMGKTTLLTSSIYQDMLSGKGLAVLDPHGDMFRELLRIVPEHRLDDVVVFDPSERDFPIGLNLLDPGIDFASEEVKRDRITSTVLSVFAKLSDKVFWGPRMEHILQNATLTALTLPSPSLYTLQQLLTDTTFQKKTARSLVDPILKQFWQKEFALLGDMQLSAVTAPLTHRLGHFITSTMSRNILMQQTSTMRITDVINEGKILLVNLSKGDLGEDQSSFFGTILTSLIWMAAYQRTKIPEPKRRDFFVYVDEFQNFATPEFANITSEGRKFHVSLIASHQNVAQVEDRDLLKIVAGNASTIICLKASPGDEQFILPFMQPEVSKGDIVSLVPYQFFMKTSGEVSEDAFSGRTVPLSAEASDLVAAEVKRRSQERYGTPRKVVEQYIESLFTTTKPMPRTTGGNGDSAEPAQVDLLKGRDLEA
jgi:hypothetical protein